MDRHSSPQPNDAIFFDVDGVLTNLNQNKVSNNLLFLLSNLIKNNFIVVLNSGRSISWLKHTILKPLCNFESQIQITNSTNFFVIGEKGGTWLNFDERFSLSQKILFDEVAKIPNKLTLMVKDLVESKFNESMFVDLTKQTMLTLERKQTASIEDFQSAQKKITLELKNILSELKLNSIIEIDQTTIAIDIQNKILGKGYGVEKVLDWLNQHEIKINQFFTVGDSSSDFEMANTLSQMGKSVLHVHVGETPAPTTINHPFLITSQKYALGTEEFFKNLIEKFKSA